MVVARKSGKNYQITAVYVSVFKTAQAAKAAAANVRKATKFARIGKIVKTAKGYNLTVKFVMVTPSMQLRTQAVKGAKANGARVSVKVV